MHRKPLQPLAALRAAPPHATNPVLYGWSVLIQSNSCYTGNILMQKTSYIDTYSAANIAVVGI